MSVNSYLVITVVIAFKCKCKEREAKEVETLIQFIAAKHYKTTGGEECVTEVE